MFIIEEMEKVREVIEKNRQRKLTKHKKLSNNTLIEIDNCSPLELLKRQIGLTKIAQGEGIAFVTGKGKHKSEIQQLYEEIDDCSECGHKARCLYRYDAKRDADKNQVMKVSEKWEDLKTDSHENIQSEKGSLNRQIRSIQTEGYFGDIKENEQFRRFHHRSAEKVYREFMLYVTGRNINKYHRLKTGQLKKYAGKPEPDAA